MKIKIDSNPTFNCNACGTCCSHLKGFISNNEKEFLKEYAFGKLPVIQLTSIENMTFPLWDWEAKRFKEWQQDVNIDANIKPLRAIYDQNSNKSIILTYYMDSPTDACPFLKDNKCTIYDKKRAYVCRLFPFNKSHIQFENNSDPKSLFGSCGSMEKILPNLPKDKDDLITYLKETFPNGEFLNALQNDLIVEWSNKTIIDLIKTNKIRPAINHPYEFLLKRINNSEKINFTDFLIKSKYYSINQLIETLDKFDNNTDAKEMLS
tara:strand:+ start:9464 stop:10255 length:792 start_codon:yes stop_codon:yes gene_type:complete